MRDYAFYSLLIGFLFCFGGFVRNISYPAPTDKWGWFIVGGPFFLFGFGYAVCESMGLV